MSGGMVRLSVDALHEAPIEGLVRLACWMGLVVMGPWRTVGEERHALVMVIAAAEKRLAKMSRAKRLTAYVAQE
jgi:hypothetical protein